MLWRRSRLLYVCPLLQWRRGREQRGLLVPTSKNFSTFCSLPCWDEGEQNHDLVLVPNDPCTAPPAIHTHIALVPPHTSAFPCTTSPRRAAASPFPAHVQSRRVLRPAVLGRGCACTPQGGFGFSSQHSHIFLEFPPSHGYVGTRANKAMNHDLVLVPTATIHAPLLQPSTHTSHKLVPPYTSAFPCTTSPRRAAASPFPAHVQSRRVLRPAVLGRGCACTPQGGFGFSSQHSHIFLEFPPSHGYVGTRANKAMNHDLVLVPTATIHAAWIVFIRTRTSSV